MTSDDMKKLAEEIGTELTMGYPLDTYPWNIASSRRHASEIAAQFILAILARYVPVTEESGRFTLEEINRAVFEVTGAGIEQLRAIDVQLQVTRAMRATQPPTTPKGS